MKAFNLHGRVALVTGGNGGLGLGMALGLVEAGSAVLIAGRNAEKNASAVAALRDAGGRAESVVADVLEDGSGTAAVAEAVRLFGRLDILINNAGMNIRKRPEAYTLEEWRRVLETNLTSAFVFSQAAHPELRRGGGGKIINIGSMMSIFGGANLAPYGASKGGIVQLTRSLAAAWAVDNIQVNAILPGWIDTDLTRRARQDLPDLDGRVLSRTPAGRWGVPADLAGTAVFLASAACDFITGAAIPVDGGYSISG